VSELNEPVLEDDYPVWWDYAYVVDGNVKLSPIAGTVRDLKREFKAEEIRRCDIIGRQLLKGGPSDA